MSRQPDTEAISGSSFDHGSPEKEHYLDCVHCGFCLPTCPTYLVLGNEMDSPRGRIYLARAVSEGKTEITDSFVKHMNLCLLCRACETACPSGVKFGFLMESARDRIEQNYEYSRAERWFRDSVLGTFTDVGRLGAITRLLRIYQRSGLQSLVRASGILKLFGRLGNMESLLPAVPNQRLRKELPEVMPAKGEKRGRVGLLIGCVQRFFFPHVNIATARVLSENGYEVVVPEEQECCGSLLVHEGEKGQAAKLARKTIDIFDRLDVDVVVVNAAGCGSVMKEYWELLRDDPAYAKRAETFSKKVRDVCEFLSRGLVKDGLKEVRLTVTYHDACHLVHGQKIGKDPRAILQAIPGLKLVELEESDYCCGSAGVYNVFHPDPARKFLERKIERIKETGAEIVASGNPGCSLQIEKGLKEKGLNIRAVHPVELLDRSYRGGDKGDV